MHGLRSGTRQSGVALVSVMVLLIVGVSLTGAMITLVNHNVRDARFRDEDLVAEYVAQTAVNRAIYEIVSDVDADADGLGALGVAAPENFLDEDGNVIAEYRAIVRFEDDCRQVLMAVAAIPDFDNPRSIHSMQAVLETVAEFTLLPTPGAVSISGPLNNPEFPDMGSNTLVLNGGDSPAISISEETSYQKVMDVMTGAFEDGSISDTEVTGAVGETYTQADGDEFELPIQHRESSFLTAQELNDYRDALRALAETMADSADRIVEGEVHGDQTWGTEDYPEVVVIDAGIAGPSSVFNTSNQTIRGHGTLIIKHTLTPDRDLNLDWTGDILVLGYDGDGGDLLYTKGTQGTINGNLILLSNNDTEASLEMGDSSNRSSDLTVNGGVLCLAEADSHESEVEVEDSSRLVVNGMLGLYGSRIELQVAGSSASLEVNGTLAMGLPAGSTRSDDFEFEMIGSVAVNWDKTAVVAAMGGLAGLETDMSFAEDGTTRVDGTSGDYSEGVVNPMLIPATMVTVGIPAMEDFHAVLEGYGETTDYGVDMSCMPARVPEPDTDGDGNP